MDKIANLIILNPAKNFMARLNVPVVYFKFFNPAFGTGGQRLLRRTLQRFIQC
jgi:hypothetical protein